MFLYKFCRKYYKFSLPDRKPDSPNRLWTRDETRRAANDVNNRHIGLVQNNLDQRRTRHLCLTFLVSKIQRSSVLASHNVSKTTISMASTVINYSAHIEVGKKQMTLEFSRM